MHLFSSLPLLLTAAALVPASALAAPLCPTLTGASSAYYTADTAASGNCNTIITINSSGMLSVAYPNTNPYDGNDDNYVGIINNYGSAVNAVTLTGTTDIFGFDGDGIDAFGISGNPIDVATYGTGAYGGADAFFTNITSASTVGTVNFIGGLAANGGTGYFSLEEAPSAGQTIGGSISTTPEPSSLALLGTGILGAGGILRRRWLNS